MEKKIEKKFFGADVIASELISLNCVYWELDTIHWQPMC